MNIFDTHCDTLYEITYQNKSMYKNTLNIDLKRMYAYDKYTQFFAAWIENEENAWEKFFRMSEVFDSEMEKNSKIVMKCLNYNDLKSAHTQNKAAAFLTVEGAYMVTKKSDIDVLYNKGVRCVTLTWNGGNKLAGGVNAGYGLSELGKSAVEYMQSTGIIVDVSHLNDKSFWDVAGIAKKPIIASHSNSRSICKHNRNLTDEQFTAVRDLGGCVGINFYPLFLSDNSIASIDDLIFHIKHFISLGGEDNIGLGSDFDGVSSLPDGIKGIEDMEKIVSAMKKNGFSKNQIEKITHINFERVLKETLSN